MGSPREQDSVDRLDSILRAAHERSSLYDWLDMNYEQIARLTRGRRIRWKELIAYVAAEGVRDGDGKVPTADRMSTTWRKVRAARGREGGRMAGAARPTTDRHELHAGQGRADRSAAGVSVGSAVAAAVPVAPSARRADGGSEVAGYGEPRRPPPPNKELLAVLGDDLSDEQVEAVKNDARGEADYEDRGKNTVFNRGKWRAGA